jgi:acetyl esterase/lipase
MGHTWRSLPDALLVVLLLAAPLMSARPDENQPERAHKQFLNHEYEAKVRLIDEHRHNRRYDACLETIRAGQRQGLFFFLLPIRDELSAVPGFTEALEENGRLRRAAIAAAVSTVQVVSPDGVDPDRKYPLLIVLHGGNSTARSAQKHWHSELLRREFIVAFVQSYLHYGMTTFGWAQADPRARRDIRRIYEETLEHYPVDPRRVIVAGMSAGGETAIDAVVNEVLPAIGFIGVCPGKPLELERSAVVATRDLGVRGFVIGGESDFYKEEQEQMHATFDDADLPHEFHIIAGLGHDYPSGFADWIDTALKFILKPATRSSTDSKEAD